jgi:serine/threonine protein kinase
MFEMLNGEVPFTGASFAQVWEQHLHRSPPRVRDRGIDCPEWLDDLITRLMAKRPNERPHNARNVQGYLLEHLTEEHVADLQLQLPRPVDAEPEDDRIPLTRWLLALAAVSVLIALFWLLKAAS